MAEDKKNDRCCDHQTNIIEIDGTHVCMRCGLVSDMVCFYDDRQHVNTIRSTNALINEFCARGEIDNQSQITAEEMYEKWMNKYSTLDKTVLMACSIYIACKKNLVPRTMKEISALTGCSIKQLGRYEHILSPQHFETEPMQYIDRFCCKLYLSMEQVKNVKLIMQNTNLDRSFNPVSIAASVIYKALFFSKSNVSIIDIENISGVPSSTIKRICKLII